MHKRRIRHHLLGFPVRRRVLDLPRGLSPELRRWMTEQGICGVLLGSTNVVLRDGRQSRSWRADVAQLVAHHLAKVRVAGSNPVIRSKVRWHQPQRWSGRVVRQRPAKPCTRVRFPSPPQRFVLGAISSAGERFPDTEEVTGSIPVSRTKFYLRLYGFQWPPGAKPGLSLSVVTRPAGRTRGLGS